MDRETGPLRRRFRVHYTFVGGRDYEAVLTFRGEPYMLVSEQCRQPAADGCIFSVYCQLRSLAAVSGLAAINRLSGP